MWKSNGFDASEGPRYLVSVLFVGGWDEKGTNSEIVSGRMVEISG